MHQLPPRSTAKVAQPQSSHDDAMLLVFLGAVPSAVIGLAVFMILALLVRG